MSASAPRPPAKVSLPPWPLSTSSPARPESNAPGSYGGLHLVVGDIEAAHADLRGRGIEVSEPYHFGAEGQAPGIHPERTNYGTYLSFSDPDGNGWLVQEVGHNT